VEMLNELGEINNCKQLLIDLHEQISYSKNSLERIKHEYVSMEEKLNSRAKDMTLCKQLEENGIFLSDLIRLRNKVLDIAEAISGSENHVVSPLHAYERFVRDVETQYCPKLGFEKKIQEVRASLHKTQQQLTLMSEYSRQGYVYTQIQRSLVVG
jgi:hypothetical protein